MHIISSTCGNGIIINGHTRPVTINSSSIFKHATMYTNPAATDEVKLFYGNVLLPKMIKCYIILAMKTPEELWDAYLEGEEIDPLEFSQQAIDELSEQLDNEAF